MNFPFVNPGWLEDITQDHVELYLRFLEGLRETERTAYVSYRIKYVSSGDLAPLVAAKDVQIKKIWLCGCDGPCIIPSSDTVERFVKEIEERWEDIVSVTYPGSAYNESRHYATYHQIEAGIEALLLDILFNIQEEAEIDCDMSVQRALVGGMLLDIPRTRLYVKQWLARNPLPLEGPLPRKLSSFEQKIGGWYHMGKFIPCQRRKYTMSA